ncbi:MAG: formyltransferase family protein, partial [Ignavibacteria bacterium]
MKITMIGFTGLGNAVLRGLLKSRDVTVNSVFTKKYEHPYPYYKEIQMVELCRRNNLNCYLDKEINSNEVVELLKKEKPDLIFVASFNQILSKDVIEIPKLGTINLHPSLLPKYRGPYPDQAVLLNGENQTGVTIHYMEEALDSGNIIFQKELEISPDDNYSSLKKKIAELAEEVVPVVVSLFSNGVKPEGI